MEDFTTLEHAFPALLLRSALFSAVPLGEEREIRKAVVPVASSWLKITATGPALGQFDRSVFEAILNLASIQFSSDSARFKSCTLHTTITKILRGMARTDDSSSVRNRVDASLRRFVPTTIKIEGWKEGIATRLEAGLLASYLVTSTGQVEIVFSPRVLGLFIHGRSTLNPEICAALARKPLTSWLYGWIRGCEDFPRIFAQSPEHLMGLSGCSMSKATFKSQLKKSLEELVNLKIVASYDVPRTGNVQIRRPGGARLNSFASRTTDPEDAASNHNVDVVLPVRNELDAIAPGLTPEINKELAAKSKKAAIDRDWPACKAASAERRIRAGKPKPGDLAWFPKKKKKLGQDRPALDSAGAGSDFDDKDIL